MSRYGMKRLFCAISLIGFALSAANICAEDNKWTRLVAKAGDTLKEIQERPLQGIPENLLEKACAIAVFPQTTSAGFLIGGQYGSGIIMAKDQASGQWSCPAIFDIAGGSSVGFQIGGENTDLVFLFMDKQDLSGIMQGRFRMGSDGRVLPGPMGRTAHIDSEAQLKGVILSYYRSRDVFAGVALGGGDLTENLPANKELYGADLPAVNILRGKNRAAMPTSADAILKVLIKQTPEKVIPNNQ